MKATKFPTLKAWTCYFNNGKNSYDVTVDGVKYMINPVFQNVHGKLIGYSLSSFHQSETMHGYMNVAWAKTVENSPRFERYLGQVPTFSRADSAAKAARLVHAKRPA